MYGLIYCPLIRNEIDNKDDGIVLDVASRPWLKHIPLKFQARNEEGVMCTTSDISIYYYIKWKYPDAPLKLLDPHVMTEKDIAANNLNFYFIYNRGEAYSFDIPYHYNRMCKLLDHPRVYPPPSWQQLVDHKQTMYDYLIKHQVNVLPYLYVTGVNITTALLKVTDFVEGRGYEKFILRPEYGTTSNDVFVHTISELDSNEFKENVQSLIRKYPGFIVTQFIHGVKKFGEFKVYFVGNKPFCVYHLFQSVTEEMKHIQKAYDPYDPVVADATRYATKIFAKLPPYLIDNVEYPRIITRIDLACCLQDAQVFDESKLFVTEIESVPSLLGSLKEVFMDVAAAEQMYKIMMMDTFRRNASMQSGRLMWHIWIVLLCMMIIMFTILVFADIIRMA